jgi:hypothetical protein
VVDKKPELRIDYASREAFEVDYQQSLRKGRAFVAGASAAAERTACILRVTYPGAPDLALDAEVVWIKSDAPEGVGVQLGDAARQTLRELVEAPSAPVPASPSDVAEPEPADDDDAGGAAPGRGKNLHERVRTLSARERDTMARQGSLPERVALERCFGSTVWEGLLQNAQVTPPEVGRIAKNGALTRPIAALILANPAWLSVGEIQRALLSNPRVGGPQLERVLRALSRADLERAVLQSAYRSEVRSTAKRLLGK